MCARIRKLGKQTVGGRLTLLGSQHFGGIFVHFTKSHKICLPPWFKSSKSLSPLKFGKTIKVIIYDHWSYMAHFLIALSFPCQQYQSIY